MRFNMAKEKRETTEPATRGRASVAQEAVTSVLGENEYAYDPENPDRVYDADEEVLLALGYRPEFKREFTLFTTFSVSFAVLGLLPSFATTLYYGMGYAGTAGMTWGWLIAMIGIQSVAMSMAELCSSMPTSGGLYYAAAVLAPPGWGPFAAWLTGWSNWFGQVTSAPSVNFGTSQMILASAAILNPGYNPTNWQVFLLTVLIMIIHTFMSSLPTRKIAQFNSYGSTFNFIALVIVLILIPACDQRQDRGLPKFNSSHDVWTKIYHGEDGTNWPDGIAVLMCFLAIIWTLSGYDSPFHLSEECSNANVASPRAIVMTSSFGGLFGWFLQLAVAYTVVDITKALNAPQPFAGYLVQVVSVDVTLVILALTIVAGFCMGQGCMVAASRVTFAYARDDCFPYSNIWAKVNKTTKTPVWAVVINSVIGILLLLLIMGGPATIGAIFSVGAIAQYVAFTIPIFIRLFMVGKRFRPGPWNLGRFTYPIGIIACAFVTLMLPIMCFPEFRGSENTPRWMNWTSLVYGGPMLLVTIWWFISARKWFKGPKVNVEHMMFGREEQVAQIKAEEGKEVDSNSSHDSQNEKMDKMESEQAHETNETNEKSYEVTTEIRES